MPFSFSRTVKKCPRDSAVYRLDNLNTYQRLIQYFSLAAEMDAYPLDLVNFSPRLFSAPINLTECENLLRPEHGYASPDGACELGAIIREFQIARVLYANRHFQLRTSTDNLANMGAGVGSGSTGAFLCVLGAIRDFIYSRNRTGTCSHSVHIAVPAYSIFQQLVSQAGFECREIPCHAESNYLPTLQQIEAVVDEKPAAIMLTFPTNPAQTTYDRSNLGTLEAIVRLCQDNRVFLIVDNVYEDAIWTPENRNPEVFSFSESCDYLVKIFGPSKDRPGFSGFRIGYWCGDARLQERYLYHASINFNTVNSVARSIGAVDLIFRLANTLETDVSSDYLELLGRGTFGWLNKSNCQDLAARINDSGLKATYDRRINDSFELQRTAIMQLRDYFSTHEVFEQIPNQNIGNLGYVTLRSCGFENSHELFLQLLEKRKIAILPDNAFGETCVSEKVRFRMTTVQDDVETLIEKLETVAEFLIASGNYF